MSWNPEGWLPDGWLPEGWLPEADNGEDVVVPDVVGDDQATGTATLEGLGFVVVAYSSYHPTVPVGDIISQNPVGGSLAPDGSTVEITVSAGPAPAPGGDDMNLSWQTSWKNSWRNSYG